MMEELQLLERAGLGFGEKETYKIYSAIKKLCLLKGAQSMVFWGKIFGLQKDYYVVQASVEGGEEGELPPNVEPKGTGVNEKVYFVTTNRKKNTNNGTIKFHLSNDLFSWVPRYL